MLISRPLISLIYVKKKKKRIGSMLGRRLQKSATECKKEFGVVELALRAKAKEIEKPDQYQRTVFIHLLIKLLKRTHALFILKT